MTTKNDLNNKNKYRVRRPLNPTNRIKPEVRQGLFLYKYYRGNVYINLSE